MIIKHLSVKITYQGFPVTYTWLPINDIKQYSPVAQIYGLCLNDDQQVLICRETESDRWGLPGGTPEGAETPVDTLRRELVEEVDIKVDQIKLLGLQQVKFPHNPNHQQGELFYQARFFCHIIQLLPQTTDPDTGLIYQRKFVSLSDLNQHLNWGAIGDAIVSQARAFLLKS